MSADPKDKLAELRRSAECGWPVSLATVLQLLAVVEAANEMRGANTHGAWLNGAAAKFDAALAALEPEKGER